MRALIIPDLHGKTIWKDAIKQIVPDRIVFLGDYVDDFPPMTSEQIVTNLEDIIRFAKETEDVELLMGNHDAQYLFLGDRKFECSGYRKEYAQTLKILFNENKNLFKIATKVDQYICTHAGITTQWAEECLDDTCIIEQLNAMLLTSHFNKLAIVSKHRGGWFPYGSPIWADISEEYLNIPQITGHNRVDNGIRYDDETYFCDCLDGVNEFLVVENGVVEIVNIGCEIVKRRKEDV